MMTEVMPRASGDDRKDDGLAKGSRRVTKRTTGVCRKADDGSLPMNKVRQYVEAGKR